MTSMAFKKQLEAAVVIQASVRDMLDRNLRRRMQEEQLNHGNGGYHVQELAQAAVVFLRL